MSQVGSTLSNGSKSSGLPAVWVVLMDDDEKSLDGKPDGV